MTPSFNYNSFLDLSDDALVEYMCSVAVLTVSPEAIELLRGGLLELDDEHLVYAIMLGGTHAPEEFAPVVSQFFGHMQESVRIAAYDFYERLPVQMLTNDIRILIQTGLASCPSADIRNGLAKKVHAIGKSFGLE